MTSDELLANWVSLSVDLAVSGRELPPPPRKVGRTGQQWAAEFCKSLASGRSKSGQEDAVPENVQEIRDGLKRLVTHAEQALDTLEQLAMQNLDAGQPCEGMYTHASGHVTRPDAIGDTQ